MPRIFEGDRRVVRQGLQQRQIARAETVFPYAIEQFDDPQALVANAHRDGDDGPRFHFCLFVHLREKPRVLGGVGDHHDFAGLGHPAGYSLAQRYANFLERFGALPGGDLEKEVVSFGINQQERPSVWVEHLFNLFHDGVQDLVELQGRGERLPHLVKDGEFADFVGLAGVRRIIAATIDALKLFGFSHVVHVTSGRPKPGLDTTPRAQRLPLDYSEPLHPPATILGTDLPQTPMIERLAKVAVSGG